MNSVRASVIQSGPLPFNLEGTLDKLGDLINRSADDGAQLVVLPEAFVGGYPKGLDFGARVGTRSAAGRRQFRRYYESAIDVPGPATAKIGEMAAGKGVHLVVGIVERDLGTLYCSVLFFGPDGTILGKHRKLMPTASERLIWGFGDGSTLPVVPTAVGRLGAVICWENYMPLLRAAMYAKGIEIYCAPTVDQRETWIPTVRHIAMEGRCFVLSACQYIRRDQYPADYPIDESLPPDSVLIRGGSVIVDPLGQVLAGPVYDEERIHTVDLDLGRIAEGKYDLDVVGHYARPDVLRLTVNERSAPAVEYDGDEIAANPANSGSESN